MFSILGPSLDALAGVVALGEVAPDHVAEALAGADVESAPGDTRPDLSGAGTAVGGIPGCAPTSVRLLVSNRHRYLLSFLSVTANHNQADH